MQINVDIVIIGGGIAGLWTLHELTSQGYRAILLENAELGGTQTMASQGMIHGGQRYALQGLLTKHSESIASMPALWDACLAGEASPDLSAVNVLAHKQHIWSPPGISGGITSFFASKAMNSKVNTLDRTDWPEVFQVDQDYKANIYELNEVVLDIQTLVKALSANYADQIFKVEQLEYDVSRQKLNKLVLNETISLSASHYVFTAGIGNEKIAELLSPNKQITQRRPLKQVLVKELDYPLYAHCIAVDPRPRVTISAHPTANGKFIWYLGGLVAVKALELGDEAGIANAQSEMQSLFPWIDWSNKSWMTLDVDRAEPYVKSGFLPDGPQIKELGNCLLAWPTKLTFAPLLAKKVVKIISKSNASKKETESDNGDQLSELQQSLVNTEIADYPWDDAKWTRV